MYPAPCGENGEQYADRCSREMRDFFADVAFDARQQQDARREIVGGAARPQQSSAKKAARSGIRCHYGTSAVRWQRRFSAKINCDRHLPGIVRPDNERPSRSDPARLPAVRPADRVDFSQRDEGAALLRGRAHGNAAEVVQGYPNVEVDSFDGLLVEHAAVAIGDRAAARHPRHLGLRVRVADGADEPTSAARTWKPFS